MATHLAFQGLAENEIGCARISIVAKSTNALFTGRIQKRKTNPLHRSLPTCNTRPVHTDGSFAPRSIYALQRRMSGAPRKRQLRPKSLASLR